MTDIYSHFSKTPRTTKTMQRKNIFSNLFPLKMFYKPFLPSSRYANNLVSTLALSLKINLFT